MKGELKIVTWNCNGALRKKFEFLSRLEADIYIVQECEDPERAKDSKYKVWAKNYLWIGDNKNKGLGIFATGAIELQDLKWETDGLKYFLPYRVNNNFNLIAVWTKSNNSISFRYIGQFWKYLQIHREHMNDCVILGDFNSNKIWDENHSICNHSNVVKELEDIGIFSFYHHQFGMPQGAEMHPTFYMQRNRNKPYHIDYLFVPTEVGKRITNFEIGHVDEWLEKSDHLPIQFRM